MIRPATSDDINVIYEMGSILHENYRRVNDLSQLIQLSYYHFYVVVEKNKVVGFLSVIELYDTVDIVDLFVFPLYRRKHYASQLINYMISDVNETVKLFTLEVSVDNLAAIALYERFGFQIERKRLFYYDDKDAYLMGLRCPRE